MSMLRKAHLAIDRLVDSLLAHLGGVSLEDTRDIGDIF